MRINKFVAQASGLSRRAADAAIAEGRVTINGQPAELGDDVDGTQFIRLDDELIGLAKQTTTIMLNKPVGYVCSRNGQGSATIYELLPTDYHSLKPVGRLDKDSSGLILLTNDGDLANQLTHPRYAKTKIYEIELDKVLQPLHQQMINDHGIELEDGNSKLNLTKQDAAGKSWQVTMTEGRNRQIRRTFAALGYKLTRLHRIQFGNYRLNDLSTGSHRLA
ncbi:MAG TPA: pseudouridine synthase [Candidatus Saccharimonadales bacterium]|nr:pseudouridine synthase [Candidatus Saccharimonadales bacterium]